MAAIVAAWCAVRCTSSGEPEVRRLKVGRGCGWRARGPLIGAAEGRMGDARQRIALRTHDQQLRCIVLNPSGLLVAVIAEYGQTLAVATDDDHGLATKASEEAGRISNGRVEGRTAP